MMIKKDKERQKAEMHRLSKESRDMPRYRYGNQYAASRIHVPTLRTCTLYIRMSLINDRKLFCSKLK